ncbi:unnamed protein product [Allacma fusca]|uniref:Uncharacterized protein n=1 Tax=Allacma fusca TaxID=39272 RepID=A0A8J2Q351_9HEXA|nr:unnamed protein product [Allacma fusca]
MVISKIIFEISILLLFQFIPVTQFSLQVFYLPLAVCHVVHPPFAHSSVVQPPFARSSVVPPPFARSSVVRPPFLGVTPSVRHFLGDNCCCGSKAIYNVVHYFQRYSMPGPAFRPGGQGGAQGVPQLRRPNIRVKGVCRFCIHCMHAIGDDWVACRFEYCRQRIVTPVPMPPTPDGWSICRGCKLVFIKDGQRFCGLCQWRTPAGAIYQRCLHERIRDVMNQAEAIRNMFIPGAEQQNPPPMQLPANGGMQPHPGNQQQAAANPFNDEQLEQMLLE